ncbi:MAG: 4'-phosphopantetheinyl transferase superfamily protein [Granulosicoccaceae bacterium]
MKQHHAQAPNKPPTTPPKGNQVHVWLMFHDKLQTPPQLATSPLLNEQERLRQQRFVTPELQYRFQCRREMLRRSLTVYRPDIGESDWIFTLNPYGKPQIHPAQSQNQLYFNLSHTNGLTVLAISAYEECGIDIENTAVNRPSSYLDIADRFFTEPESEQIKQGSTDAQIQRFFDFWTLKEAYIKAVGKGLSLGLDRFQFALEPASPIAIEFPSPAIDNANTWVFHQETIGEDWRLAIALRAESSEPISCEFAHYPA